MIEGEDTVPESARNWKTWKENPKDFDGETFFAKNPKQRIFRETKRMSAELDKHFGVK